MIKSKEDYKKFLEMDRLCREEKRKKPKFYGDDIWKYTILLRKIEYYNNCKKSLVFKPIKMYLKYKYSKLGVKLGIHIPINVFDSGLNIKHGGGIIVNRDARVGKNCVLYHGVTIGTTRYRGGVPQIGNNVCIAVGAKLFGNIKLGSNITVGANAVVDKSFDKDGVTIAGIPAKIISNKGSEGIVPDYVREINK